MIIQFMPDNSGFNVEFEGDEKTIAEWVLANYGATEFTMYLQRMMKQRRAQMHDEVKTGVWNHILSTPELVDTIVKEKPEIKVALHGIQQKHLNDKKDKK